MGSIVSIASWYCAGEPAEFMEESKLLIGGWKVVGGLRVDLILLWRWCCKGLFFFKALLTSAEAVEINSFPASRYPLKYKINKPGRKMRSKRVSNSKGKAVNVDSERRLRGSLGPCVDVHKLRC